MLREVFIIATDMFIFVIRVINNNQVVHNIKKKMKMRIESYLNFDVGWQFRKKKKMFFDSQPILMDN